MPSDGIEQRRALQAISRGARARDVGHEAPGDRVFDARHDEREAQGRDALVAVGDDLGEVVPGVDVEHGERDLARDERLLREVEQDGRVLPAREEERGPLTFCRDLTEHEDGLVLEVVEMSSHGASEAHVSCAVKCV
jgi:hypothetical protein